MNSYYIRKFCHTTPLLSQKILNVIQAKYPKARFFVRNILKIEIEKILIGDIHGISTYDWYKLTNDSSRLEEKIIDSPYYELFDAVNKGTFKKEEVKKYRYFTMASLCIEKLGNYFDCTNEDQLIRYICGLEKLFFSYKNKEDENSLFTMAKNIKDTDLYEVVDGHHRVAMDAVLGKKYTYMYVIGTSFSGVQKKLFDVSMTNKKELYQPMQALSVQKWPTVRNCDDRFEMLRDFLQKNDDNHNNLSLLDIACSYGYFVKKFRDLGMSTKGLEIDKNAIEIGKLSYDLQEDDYINSPLQHYLKNSQDQYDIVCFFSILHHFGLRMDFGGGGLEIKEIISLLDRMTKKYLFLDCGQNHEYWFKDKLPEWNDAYIINLILENSHFTRVEKIGSDHDNIGKYAGNYNRSLFVFKK